MRLLIVLASLGGCAEDSCQRACERLAELGSAAPVQPESCPVRCGDTSGLLEVSDELAACLAMDNSSPEQALSCFRQEERRLASGEGR